MGNLPRSLLRQQPSLFVSRARGGCSARSPISYSAVLRERAETACHTAVVFPVLYAPGFHASRSQCGRLPFVLAHRAHRECRRKRLDSAQLPPFERSRHLINSLASCFFSLHRESLVERCLIFFLIYGYDITYWYDVERKSCAESLPDLGSCTLIEKNRDLSIRIDLRSF